MVARDFKHLEILPLDEDNLVIGSDTEGNLRSKSCINLSFVSTNAVDRLSRLNRINAKAAPDDFDSFAGISYLMETFLTTILMLNSISNLDNTDTTEHYKRRLITISNAKILPSFKYCQDLTYAGFKTWGGLYGTLQYYIHLREEYEEYYTPSQVIFFASQALLNQGKQDAYANYLELGVADYNTLNQLYISYASLLEDESPDADIEIYNMPKKVITELSSISATIRDLNFYTAWIPQVFNWYITEVGRGDLSLVDNPQTNRERARNTIVRIGQVIAGKGMDEAIFDRALVNFMRQNINPDIFTLLDNFATIRKQSTYQEVDVAGESLEESLVREFHENISTITDPVFYRESSNLILSSICPPGGYALLQIMTAANLLNRAYILAYQKIQNTIPIQQTQVYRRIVKLLGLAGITLIRTNIRNVQVVGVNLLRVFNINLTNIDPNNLLDIIE